MRASVGIVAAVLAGVLAAPIDAAMSPTIPRIAYVTGGQEGPNRVWVADGNGTDARELGVGDGPLLSPNGQMVIATNDANGYAMTLYRTSTRAAKSYFRLTRVGSQFSEPLAWSPDSRYVAVQVYPFHAQGADLAVIDTRTGKAAVIVKGSFGGVAIHGASFAPGRSDELTYAIGGPIAPANIFTVDVNGRERKQITTDGRSLNPVWGRRGIAFDHERLPAKGYLPLYQIWVMRSNGSRREQITHTRVGLPGLLHGLVPLAFSADGTRLVAELEGQDTSRGYSVSILTRRSSELKVGRRSVAAWGISRDGSSALIDVGGEAMFDTPPNQGDVEQIPFAGGPATLLIAHADSPSWNQ